MHDTSKHHLAGIFVAAVLGLPLAASGAEPAPSRSEPLILAQAAGGKAELSADARKFIEEAAMAHLLEIQLGQLAADNAASKEVREFGTRMVQDHGKANSQLLQVAEPLGVTPPKRLDDKHKEKVDRFQKLKGKEFDSAYMKEMVQAHQKDVESFRKQSTGEGNPELKQYASNLLPVLQEHLKRAQDLEKKVQGG